MQKEIIEEESHEKKIKFEGEVKCPHCGFFLVVKVGKKIIEPSKTAVTEDFFEIEVSKQSRLETGSEAKDDPNIKLDKKKKEKLPVDTGDAVDIDKIVEEEATTTSKTLMGRAPNNTELFKTWVEDNNIKKFDRQEFIDAYECITKEKATKIIFHQINLETIRQLGTNRFEVIKEL
ncbi:MAG: hypothetical protein KAS32_13740 [Candidatus Peribacteraceae bacterium]|nr:hypothetical protein [Candidatus Peribacteraceae bacterium]